MFFKLIGIRICPGRHFADATVWLIVASVLAVFDIKPYVDPKSNKEVPPEVSFTSGFSRSGAFQPHHLLPLT